MKYFKESEFVMGSEIVFDKMDAEFLAMLDELRGRCGFPFKINSSYRSPEYNKKIGSKATKSKHIEGIAVDIACTDSKKRAELVCDALIMGFSVGVAKTFIHIDSRPNQLMFTY